MSSSPTPATTPVKEVPPRRPTIKTIGSGFKLPGEHRGGTPGGDVLRRPTRTSSPAAEAFVAVKEVPRRRAPSRRSAPGFDQPGPGGGGGRGGENVLVGRRHRPQTRSRRSSPDGTIKDHRLRLLRPPRAWRWDRGRGMSSSPIPAIMSSRRSSPTAPSEPWARGSHSPSCVAVDGAGQRLSSATSGHNAVKERSSPTAHQSVTLGSGFNVPARACGWTGRGISSLPMPAHDRVRRAVAPDDSPAAPTGLTGNVGRWVCPRP